ncbi:MAG TPA: hypothetical protein VEK08_05165 [Planctomycetota bacterium]|nr:hypothetical protein [Planctomycetota bacterium]
MEEAFFTVTQVTSILGCDRATVYRLIANGWLNQPAGKTKQETGGLVTQKSLYQLLIIDRLSCFSAQSLQRLRYRRKVFEKSESLMPQANRLSINEGRGEASDASAPASSPADKRSDQPRKCLHHDFAEQHQFSLGWKARQLAPDDPAMQDDLIQEMSLALLEYDKPASFEFLFELATNRAKDYLKYEVTRGMLPLSQVRQMSDKLAQKLASLNAFIEDLLKRGVPEEWIEEVLGERLDAA